MYKGCRATRGKPNSSVKAVFVVDIKMAEEFQPRTLDFKPGDSVKVSMKVLEGDKERIQIFEGVVLMMKGRGPGATFTVRRLSRGVGVERTFPSYSPRLEKVEIMRHGRVRRARLFYLRGLSGKKARIKEGARVE